METRRRAFPQLVSTHVAAVAPATRAFRFIPLTDHESAPLDYRTAQDWIVGAVSVLLGLAVCYGAFADPALRARFKLTRFVTEKFGPLATRALCILIGGLFIAIGVAIACGYSLELIGK